MPGWWSTMPTVSACSAKAGAARCPFRPAGGAAIVLMGTLGKAAGVGAFVAADPVVIDWLVNKARSYISPPPRAR